MIYKLVIPTFYNTKESLQADKEMEEELKAMGREDEDYDQNPELFRIVNLIVYTDGILEVIEFYFDKDKEGTKYSKLKSRLDYAITPLSPEDLVELIDKQIKEQTNKIWMGIHNNILIPKQDEDITNKLYKLADKQIKEDEENRY